MASNCILVLLDGLGDRAYPELGNRTPLQAAETPNLDYLADKGWCGLLHATRPGRALPSENAHFAMFGYRKEEFPGRGYLEALGADVPLAEKDVALLAHFVEVKVKKKILYLHKNRPAATPAEIKQLVDAVHDFKKDNCEVRFWPTHGVDGVVTIAGKVAPQITDVDPIDQGMALMEPLPIESAPLYKKAQYTADVLKSYLVHCHEILSVHPVNKKRKKLQQPLLNGLVTQRAGQWRQVQPFSERWGLQGLTIASGLVYWGLGRFLGMDVCPVKDSDDPGKDLADRIDIALRKRKKHDFIHVHTKAPDAAAHSKDCRNKVAAIEALDGGLKPLLNELAEDTLLVVTADHSTPSSGPLVHSGEPVPIMIIGSNVRCDTVKKFDEVACATGGLGYLQGKDLMPMILNCLDRIKLEGLMDTPNDQVYWPGQRQPFQLK